NKAAELNPNNLRYKERLAQIYFREKQTDKAIEQYKEIITQSPVNIDVHVNLGLLYFEDKQFDRAVDEFRVVLEARPNNSSIRYYLAIALAEMDRNEEAIEELKGIIAQEPKNISAFLYLAFLYSKLNRDDDAIAIYEEILSFEKEKPEVYLYLAATHTHKKEYAKAEVVLKEGLTKFGGHDDLNFNLAVVFERTGRFDDMVRYLRNTIEINPNHADALNYLGYSYADRGVNLEEARELILKALDLKPDSGYIMDSLGWVYFKSGKREEALKVLLRAAEIVKNDPVVLEHVGDVYHSMGLREKAVEFWKKAIEFHAKGEDEDEDMKDRIQKKIEESR
ncbi:MAG: tetratricopeptide repeat protein, partial [Nitrospirota bacterium]